LTQASQIESLEDEGDQDQSLSLTDVVYEAIRAHERGISFNQLSSEVTEVLACGRTKLKQLLVNELADRVEMRKQGNLHVYHAV
jgi:hypothetical protein